MRHKILLLSLLYICIQPLVKSQTDRQKVYDLLEQLNKADYDTTKVNVLNKLSEEFIPQDIDKSAEYAKQSIELATKIGYYQGLSKAYLRIAISHYYQYNFDSIIYYYEKNREITDKVTDWRNEASFENLMGLVFHIQSDYNEAILHYKKSLNKRVVFKDKAGSAKSYNDMGAAFYDQGNYEKALDNYFRSLEISEEIKDSSLISLTLANIGGVYEEQEKFDNALEYYIKGNKIAMMIGEERTTADTYRNIGGIYSEKHQFDSALMQYEKSLEIYQKLDDVRGVVVVYNIFGQNFVLRSEFLEGRSRQITLDKALGFFKKSLALNNKEIDEIEERIVSFRGMGEIFIYKKQYQTAISYLLQSKKMALEIESLDNVREAHQFLSIAYSKIGNFKEAYENHVMYKNWSDTLKNDENIEMLTQMSMQHEFDKKQKEQEFQQAQRELEYQQKQKRDRLIRFFILIVLVIVSGFSIQVLRSYQRKKKDNLLLAQQKTEIEKQKEEITDSIRYAKRIQTAVLPSNEFAGEILPEHFILFRPRDIVSGDYYWMNKVDNKVIIAAADCTGHGVPGAFMSMLGVSFLNEIVNKNNQVEPHLILNQLRAQVKRTLGQTGKEGEAKDGMDIAICVIDFDNMKMNYSGAYNPLYLYRNGELIETKADKMPIGIYIREKESFTNHEIELQKGDTFYIFSDGYVDQFGGVNGGKFKSKPFKAFLASIQSKSMPEQREILDKNIDEWRGDIDQIDDIIVLGVRV